MNAPVVLHGLGLTRRSMQPLARNLATHGFQPLKLDDPSRRYSLETLAGRVWADLQTHFGSAPSPLNFVNHSMGGCVSPSLAQVRHGDGRTIFWNDKPNYKWLKAP